ncbi:MAG: hypothetical protein ACI31M_00960 [Bacilli bacterium]
MNLDDVRQENLRLRNENEELKGRIEMLITQVNYWQYLAEIERDKKEKLQDKIVRLDKIIDRVIKEDK